MINLHLDQGVPYNFTIPTGADPTGWTAHLQIRDQPGGLVFADLAVGTGITLGNSGDQNLHVRLTAAQIAEFPLQAVWDVIATPVGLDPIRLAEGTVYVSPQVTH